MGSYTVVKWKVIRRRKSRALMIGEPKTVELSNNDNDDEKDNNLQSNNEWLKPLLFLIVRKKRFKTLFHSWHR
jgi:hypothetical protein